MMHLVSVFATLDSLADPGFGSVCLGKSVPGGFWQPWPFLSNSMVKLMVTLATIFSRNIDYMAAHQ